MSLLLAVVAPGESLPDNRIPRKAARHKRTTGLTRTLYGVGSTSQGMALTDEATAWPKRADNMSTGGATMTRTKEVTRKTHTEAHYADGSVEMRSASDCNRIARFHPNASDAGQANDYGRADFETRDHAYSLGIMAAYDFGVLPRNEALPLMRTWVKA